MNAAELELLEQAAERLARRGVTLPDMGVRKLLEHVAERLARRGTDMFDLMLGDRIYKYLRSQGQ